MTLHYFIKKLHHSLSIAIICLLTMLGVSCEKPEIPVVLPPKPGDSTRLFAVELGDQYDKQVFVNLDNEQVSTINGNSWDLYFNCGPDEKQVFINGGKGVLLASTGSLSFRPNVDVNNLKWRWDEASGYDDSLALTGWYDRQHGASRDTAYVIDRGPSITDPAQRYFQFQITGVDATGYTLRIANIDGSNPHDVSVLKNANKMHVYFSFENGGTYLDVEPPKTDWDFCFLRYRWIYYEYHPPLLYTVTGIFINQSQVSVAVDSTFDFYKMTWDQCKSLRYTTRRDVMGFDYWKAYNFTTGKYVAKNYVNFVLRMQRTRNLVYKLRFVDFYSSTGVKGTPKFEFEPVWW